MLQKRHYNLGRDSIPEAYSTLDQNGKYLNKGNKKFNICRKKDNWSHGDLHAT